MSYIHQVQDPRSRIAAIAGTAAIHAAIGAGLLIGLTVTGVAPPIDTWDPFDLTPDPLPKPPPPEPQTRQPEESFVTVPPNRLEPLVNDPADIVTRDPVDQPPGLVVDPGPAITPVVDPPRPLATFAPRGVRPTSSPSGWIRTDDYPAGPLRREIEGTAAYRLVVGTSGQVSACEVTRSTGNGQLDEATCRFIERRARFEAATDRTGAKVVGSYTGTVKWEIPD
jgi:protein TonB